MVNRKRAVANFGGMAVYKYLIGRSGNLNKVTIVYLSAFVLTTGAAQSSDVRASCSSAYAETVVAFTAGTGATHPNFINPADALGPADYFDPGTGFGTGAVALGAGGTITLRMAREFTIGGSPAADLVVYEIGASEGGSAEATRVEISQNGTVWVNIGSTPGGTSGLDIDSFGFTINDQFRFVRLTDLTQLTGQPAGADVDAVAVLNTVSGDVDDDGDVDPVDASLLADVLLGIDNNPQHVARADINCDAAMNGLDIHPFVQILLTDP